MSNTFSHGISRPSTQKLIELAISLSVLAMKMTKLAIQKE
jgi:hypothetical protein